MKTAAIALAAALLVAACAAHQAGPPEIVLDRSACSHCGMLVSERIYAAALRTSDRREQVFDDIGCLLAAVRAQSLTGAHVWVHDALRGTWIDGASATFVSAPSLRTPMAGGIVAFADRDAADRSAERLGAATVTSLARLLSQKGGGQ